MKKNYKYGVIGSGSWATALIKILSENVKEINWYVRNSENIDFIKTNSHNPNYLSCFFPHECIPLMESKCV